MRIIIDTNVYIYYYVPPEYVKEEKRSEWKELRDKSKVILQNILAEKHTLVIPATVLIEIASQFFKLTKDEEGAGKIIGILKKENVTKISYLDYIATEQLISLIYQSRLTAVDSTIAACCLTENAMLVTNDKKLYQSIKNVPKEDNDEVFDAILLRNTSKEQLSELFG